MITSLLPVREILIATPGLPSDLYRMHQTVWLHAVKAAKPGKTPRFLYRVENGMVKIRSPDFNIGTVREFRAGRPCTLDIAAVIQSVVHGQQPVPRSALHSWAVNKLNDAGFYVRQLQVLRYEIHRGVKRDRNTAQKHLIELPVARIQLDLEIEDRSLADAAWCHGIGRGRRFGFGMLCH